MNTEAEHGAKIEMAWNASYIRNGRSNDIGTLRLTLTLPGQPEPLVLTYSMAASGTWEIIDGFLAQTTTEFKFVNLSHPGLDSIINLTDMFPQNVSDSAKILALDEQHLVLQSETTGIEVQCRRIRSKA